MNKFRTGVVAGVIGALSLAGAVPAHASTADRDACQIMGPQYVEGVVGCACVVIALLAPSPVPDVKVCSR